MIGNIIIITQGGILTRIPFLYNKLRINVFLLKNLTCSKITKDTVELNKRRKYAIFRGGFLSGIMDSLYIIWVISQSPTKQSIFKKLEG